MKTRFFFLLLAAVLLGSVSVNAQSETPLKGDVNGDGKVDVADIVAVIEIMKKNSSMSGETKYYWYIGTSTDENAITAANYTDFYEQTEEMPITTTMSVYNEYIFIIIPSSNSLSITTVDGSQILNTYAWNNTNNTWSRGSEVLSNEKGDYILYRTRSKIYAEGGVKIVIK